MRLHRWLLGLGLAAALAAPTSAAAKTTTYTLRYGPIAVGGFETVVPKVAVKTPGVGGYIVRMHARLVDRRGVPVTVRDVMMHHVYFQRRWRAPTRYECQNAG